MGFLSRASNLVPGDSNGSWDVFVRDRRSGQTRLESVTDAGEPLLSSGPDGGAFGTRLAPDGRFLSLVQRPAPQSVLVRDRDRRVSQGYTAPAPGCSSEGWWGQFGGPGLHGGPLRLRKNGVEWIANLGNPEQLPAQGLLLDRTQLPEAFEGTLLGARFSALDVLHESHYVGATLRPNLLFSGSRALDELDAALGDEALAAAYAQLAAGSDGWLDHWRRLPPQPGQTAAVAVHDEDSLSARLGGDFGGAFPCSIALPLLGESNALPVFGAVGSAPGDPDPGRRGRGVGLIYPLRLGVDGRSVRLESAQP